jgi:RNA polymerase sigma factor (sigma-70 family)
MDMRDEEQLLREYVEARSESAFGELVARHIDMVYAAALRMMHGDVPLAKDVTQTVFIDLARKAHRLPQGVVLAGWLHRHTCFTAATAVRAERRRRLREQAAMELQELNETASSWESIAPHLDECLNQLSAADREALVLRFLKSADFRTVGARLGINEDAAQKRVSRALEKLRRILTRRGMNFTAGALTTLIATHPAGTAPVGLGTVVTAVSLKSAADAGAAFSLLKLMGIMKFQAGAVALGLIVSVIATFWVQSKADVALSRQNAAFQTHLARIAALQKENEGMATFLGASEYPLASDNAFKEVLRLRGEVGRLRAALRELNSRQPNAPLTREEVLMAMKQLYQNRVEDLKRRFAEDPAQAVPDLGYVTEEDWVDLENYDHHRVDPDKLRHMSQARFIGQLRFAENVASAALKNYSREHNRQFPSDVSELAPYLTSPQDLLTLQGWTILPKSSLPDFMRIDEDWVLTQRGSVNREIDQRLAVGLRGEYMGHGGTNDWLLNNHE